MMLAPLLVAAAISRAAAPSSAPARVCDPRDFGAKADGSTRDTAAIQAAIDACAETGGTIHLHGGTYLSGMITLKSRETLQIDAGATLKGTQNDDDYPTVNPPTDNSQLSNCRKSLVYAESATNIAITGKGAIDGSGGAPQWQGSSKDHPERTRPMAIFTVLSSNVTITDITVKDAAMWAVVSMEDDHVLIHGIHVHSPFGGTRDGIDLVDCHHAVIENCDVYSEDDSICLKSGSAKGIYDVTVRSNTVLQSSVANGLKLGTASTGSFRDVLFEDISVSNVDKAAMAVESVDGAVIQNVVFRRIKFQNAGTPVFVLLGKRGNPPRVGSINGVTFDNIVGSHPKHAWGSAISGSVVDGTTYSPTNIAFHDVHVTFQGGDSKVPPTPPEYVGQYPDPNLWGDLPAYGYFLRHVDHVSFDGCTTSLAGTDARPAVAKSDARNLTTQ
jgi:polygalacturonase